MKIKFVFILCGGVFFSGNALIQAFEKLDFKEIDIDKNDALSFEEYVHSQEKEIKAEFKKFDKDEDGFLSRQELREGPFRRIMGAHEQLIQRMIDQRIRKFDKDKDEKLSYEEYKEAKKVDLRRKYDESDEDGNKTLSQEEYKAIGQPKITIGKAIRSDTSVPR